MCVWELHYTQFGIYKIAHCTQILCDNTDESVISNSDSHWQTWGHRASDPIWVELSRAKARLMEHLSYHRPCNSSAWYDHGQWYEFNNDYLQSNNNDKSLAQFAQPLTWHRHVPVLVANSHHHFVKREEERGTVKSRVQSSKVRSSTREEKIQMKDPHWLWH